jgi:hypothetical protein
MKKIFVFIAVLAFYLAPLFAQANVSVPLDDPVYRILEIAELRGLCDELPKIKPYSRKIVISLLDQISENSSNSKKPFTKTEFDVVNEIRTRFEKDTEKRFELNRLRMNFDSKEKNGVQVVAELNTGMDLELSGGYYFNEKQFYPGMTVEIPSFNFLCGINENLSFAAGIQGYILYAEREFLGDYNAYYEGYIPPDGESKYIKTYSQPKAYFPYTYSPMWMDSALWNTHKLNGVDFLSWPDGVSLSFNTMAEFGATMLQDVIAIRAGRYRREWGASTEGASLTLSKNAQPFLGIDLSIKPFSWMNISNLTGILEYYGSMKGSSNIFQNAFSLSQIEFNYKQYFAFNFGTSVVWPKRFEIGYLLPVIDHHLYQQSIGDFDNSAEFATVKVQYPGIAKAWFSFFLDEVSPEANMLELDRSLYAFMTGTQINIPFLSFATFTFMYTKVEPYCFSHIDLETPWYDHDVDESFLNHGEPLGYYLKPNSDEIKAVFEFMPKSYLKLDATYQLIRHGADFGSNAVDGSSFNSDLRGDGRSTTAELRKYFLHDGAYEWSHIIRFGATVKVPNTNFSFSAEAGVVHSYFTNIAGAANQGFSSSYNVIDTAEYPKSTGVIITLGVHIN